MYYVIQHEASYTDDKLLKIDGVIFDSNGDFVSNIFNLGNLLQPEIFKIKMQKKYSQKGELTDKIWVQVNRSSLLFVVSQKCVEVMNQLNMGEIEFLGLEFIKDGIDVNNYVIVNVLNRVDCVNDIESELVYYSDTNKIYAVELLILDESKIPQGLDLFQLDRTEKNITIVSQRFVDKINESGLTGFKFKVPQQFTIG